MGKKAKEAEAPCKETFDHSPSECVLMLNSPEEDVQIKASEAIYKFAEEGDENKVALLGLGALDPLRLLICHDNKLIRRNALMALGVMSTNADVKDALTKVNIIQSVLDRLSPEEEAVVHEFATMCLAALSVDFICKIKIFDKNGLPSLIQLLSSPDPDVQKNSLDVIFNLVQDYPCRVVVHELGGIPPLLELVKSEFPVIQLLSLKIMVNITTNRDTRATFREEQGFDKIMDTLDNPELNDLHHEALQVVANCLCDSECLSMVHHGLSRFMNFVVTPTIPEIQSHAVKCITRAAQSSEIRTLLHVQGVEKALVELLAVEDNGVKTATCHAVTAMSLRQASKDIFRDLGAIPVVVQLLPTECLLLREAAAQALSLLTHNNQLNAAAVHKAQGHKFLVQLLGGSCQQTVAHSAAVLGNMAGQTTLRNSILAVGVMQALMQPLKSSNTEVLISALQCVVVMASEANARAELLQAGGLELLVSLLHSRQKEVCHHACLAVSVCARDDLCAVDICKFGALERLKEINKCVNYSSKLAMVSLLNSNLSVKYSLTGQLAATDIIRDGFYDAGKAGEGERVLTLEELFKQPVNARRAIICVNAVSDRAKSDQQEDVEDAERDTSTSPAPSKKSQRSQSKGKKKDSEKKEEAPPEPEPPKEEPWKMADDDLLQELIQTAADSIQGLKDEQEQYEHLARLVCETMGGAVHIEKLHEFPWELHLCEIKYKVESNVVPIGMINAGIYIHRAILFKCLADRLGLSCTLVRGNYNRAWNEVTILRPEHPLQPRQYVVDLMHEPGSLLGSNSPAALRYQII